MKLYRIYTEDTSSDDKGLTDLIVANGFDGFSIWTGTGAWKGEFEASVCYEILGSEDDKEKVWEIASKIKEQNKQESVLIVELEAEASFI